MATVQINTSLKEKWLDLEGSIRAIQDNYLFDCPCVTCVVWGI